MVSGQEMTVRKHISIIGRKRSALIRKIFISVWGAVRIRCIIREGHPIRM